MNQHDGTFSEEAVLRGVAFDENGRAMSGMGAAAGDYNHTGRQSIFRTNFSDERETLYSNEGDGQFQERTISAGLGANTRYVSWGCQFFDFDNDGWSDLVLVNGHVFPEIDRKGTDLHFRQRAILYRNLRDGRFADISTQAGPGIARRTRRAVLPWATSTTTERSRSSPTIRAKRPPCFISPRGLPATGCC
jgi:enediyne biosynthesis protein E4